MKQAWTIAREMFPAPAGMNREIETKAYLDSNVSRARGDEPQYRTATMQPATMFPAPAGMNLLSCSPFPRFNDVSRARGDEPFWR